LKKAAALDPLFKFVWTNLGDVLVRLNRIDESVQAYERAIQSKPQNENAYINLGMVYVKKGELSKAALLFSDAVRANHRSEAAYTNLVLVLTKMGDLKRLHATLISAIAATGLLKFKQSYKVYEEKYPHQAFLFTKFLDNKFAEAEVYIRTELKKEPANHFFVGMLGIALAKQDINEKIVEAKIVLKQAIALNPPGKKSLEAELAKLESKK
ncbi:MAG: tetratricopeptide repeat protein, partial [Candidatus Woesearchaeota archaeon]|nr:tetratricopeptide repeat protein [Candidatus Woesearchaeota archaeon]